MTDYDAWAYYIYGIPGRDVHIEYLRYRNGDAQGLNVTDRKWVEIDGLRISRYIQKGEASLERMTRDAMESMLGWPLPV